MVNNQSYYNILSTMFSFQQKNLRHAKKQKSVTHAQEKKQVTETASEEIQILDLADKDFKATIINTLKKIGNYDSRIKTKPRTSYKMQNKRNYIKEPNGNYGVEKYNPN